jgi:hypothetical protein
MKIDGSCHCGNITFEAEVDPATVEVCHCTDCQTLSGSAFRSVVQAAPGCFRLLSGKPKIYIKTAASGARRQQAFCPDCGTPIYSTSASEEPTSYGIRVGAVRQRAELAPVAQYWCRSAQAWVMDQPGLPRHETQ